MAVSDDDHSLDTHAERNTVTSNKMKVLYIAGWDRSGSTILGQVLGQLRGFFCVGEVVDLWDRGPKALCGCGCFLKDCATWRKIFLEAFGVGPERFDFQASAKLRRQCVRSRHMCLLSNSLFKRLTNMPLTPYLDLQGRLYKAVFETSGAAVIVDSSKHPAYAYALGLCDFVELYIVHLVRDPRGCAYSWQVRKQHPDQAIEPRASPGSVKSAVHWNFANAATRSVFRNVDKHYLMVRYEDFVARPSEVVVGILDFVREHVSELPFRSQHSVLLKPLHGVSGNPARFHTGTVELKLDEKWKTAMGKKHKLIVSVLTAPTLFVYGYSFF